MRGNRRNVKLKVKGPDGEKSLRDFLADLPKGSALEIAGKRYPKIK